MEIEDFLDNYMPKIKNSYVIIEKLLNDYGYYITKDTIENDVRTIILNNYYFGNIKIISKRFFRENYMGTIEYSEIYYYKYTNPKIYETYTR